MDGKTNSEVLLKNSKDQLETKWILENIPYDLLFSLLDNSYESLILVDADGIVRFMSQGNEGVTPISVKDSIGRHIKDIRPDSKMIRVLKTGKAELGRSMVLNHKNRVIARIPLFKNGRVSGVAGKLVFNSPEHLKKFYNRINYLKSQIDYYKEELNRPYGIRYTLDNVIGRSVLIRQAKVLAQRAAESDSAVLITGESGTGKELFAHSIHELSRRKKNNFVRVNCSAIPGELIESELFGYEAGAFTGANKNGKVGKFELAHRGTIFLDEIGDMPLLLQVKLMRVLQEKEIERLGGKPKQIDFRIISATNRDLEKLMISKEFRLDLYYRLNVFTIHLPPLREIKEDIPEIFKHFLDKLNPGNKQKITTMSSEAVKAMLNYSWPGNLRELRNIAERAMILCRGGRIDLDDLPISIRQGRNTSFPGNSTGGSLKTIMEHTEKKLIQDALEKTDNSRQKAAAVLGIHRTGLYQKMKKYNIS